MARKKEPVVSDNIDSIIDKVSKGVQLPPTNLQRGKSRLAKARSCTSR